MSEELSQETFDVIEKSVPLATVEAVIIRNGKVLLLKRISELGKGFWWLPGGRVNKFEPMETAILREVYEETGLDVKIEKQLKTRNYFFQGKHAIGTPFLMKCLSTDDPKLNREHDEYQWVTLEEYRELKKVHPNLNEILSDAGFLTLTVMASGIFDLLHYGHIRYLEECKKQTGGETKLIVLVADDKTCFERKEKYPVIDENQRMSMLKSLKTVDEAIFVYNDENPTLEYVLKKYKPDFFAISYAQDNSLQTWISETINKIGLDTRIIMIWHDGLKVISTTDIKNKIKEMEK